MHISNRFVIACDVPIVIRMLEIVNLYNSSNDINFKVL